MSTAPSTPAPPRLWPAALSLGLAAGVALALGTLGYVVVGFGVLTSCTNAFSCTETGCAPCRPASAWLGAGALGQGGLLLVSVALLVVAARRPRSRRGLAWSGVALLVLTVVWVVVSTAAARSSF